MDLTQQTELLNAALRLAERHGYNQVRRDDLARALGLSPTRVSQLVTANTLPSAILRAAVAQRNLLVIAQGLALRHRIAVNAPYDLRRDAAVSIIGGKS